MNRMVLPILALSLLVACATWCWSAEAKSKKTAQKLEQAKPEEKPKPKPEQAQAEELAKPETEAEAIAALRKLGAQVGTTGYDPPKGRVTGVDFINKNTVTDDDLMHLKPFSFDTLDLQHTSITDAGLQHLKGLTYLDSLDLTNTDITDFGLENLKYLVKLRCLRMYNTRVTYAGWLMLHQALPNCFIFWGPAIELETKYEMMRVSLLPYSNRSTAVVVQTKNNVTTIPLQPWSEWRKGCEIKINATYTTAIIRLLPFGPAWEVSFRLGHGTTIKLLP
jgi:hypothetical protein